MNDPTFAFPGAGSSPAPIDFGAANALAELQAVAPDFDAGSRAYATLTPGQKHIWRTHASDTRANRDREALLSLGRQGVGPEDWVQRNDPLLHDAYLRSVATLPGSVPAPSGAAPSGAGSAAFDPLVPPTPRPDPELKGPSTLQLAAGGLFALLAPKYAALALAAPFQEGLRQHARDVERTRDENADAFERWRDGLAGAAPKAWAEFGAPTADEPEPTTNATATNATADAASAESEPGAPIPTPSVGDLRGLRSELARGRARWMSARQAERIATLERDAEAARKYAISTARGADGEGRGSRANLADALARLAKAKAMTRAEMDSLRVQAQGLQALRAKNRPDGGDLGRIQALQRARQADLDGLAALEGRIGARLAASPAPRAGRTTGGNAYRVAGP